MRIRLSLPEEVLFNYEIRVRVTDLNYANHLGNDRLLVFAQESRSAWFNSMGYHELDVHGCGTVVADAGIQFVSEAFGGDKLNISLHLGDHHRYGFDLFYRVVRDEDVIAIMKTAIIFKNYKEGTMVRSPEGFLEKLAH